MKHAGRFREQRVEHSGAADEQKPAAPAFQARPVGAAAARCGARKSARGRPSRRAGPPGALGGAPERRGLAGVTWECADLPATTFPGALPRRRSGRRPAPRREWGVSG